MDLKLRTESKVEYDNIKSGIIFVILILFLILYF